MNQINALKMSAEKLKDSPSQIKSIDNSYILQPALKDQETLITKITNPTEVNDENFTTMSKSIKFQESQQALIQISDLNLNLNISNPFEMELQDMKIQNMENKQVRSEKFADYIHSQIKKEKALIKNDLTSKLYKLKKIKRANVRNGAYEPAEKNSLMGIIYPTHKLNISEGDGDYFTS